MMKVKTTLIDRDRGFAKLVQTLGEMGAITIGVQGEESITKHPNSELTVGEIAAIHELGLGVPRRSWLRDWIDKNQDRLMRETNAALQEVIKGRISRNQALIKLGFAWTREVRNQIWDGKITPPLAPSTIAAKGGERRPLLDSGTLANSITYKVFLNQIKSIYDKTQRAAVRNGPDK